MFTKVRQQTYKILILQITIVLSLALIAVFWSGLTAGYSVFLGGLAYVVPSVFLVKKIFPSKANNRQPAKMLIDFYSGEIIKLVLSLILLVLLFKLTTVRIIPLMSGYMGACLALFFLPLVVSF